MGIPQAIDPKTMFFVFGHYARIQVEIDLFRSLPSSLLVEREGYNFEVPVTFESLPKFCSNFLSFGHLVGEYKQLKRVQEAAIIHPFMSDPAKNIQKSQ